VRKVEKKKNLLFIPIPPSPGAGLLPHASLSLIRLGFFFQPCALELPRSRPARLSRRRFGAPARAPLLAAAARLLWCVRPWSRPQLGLCSSHPWLSSSPDRDLALLLRSPSPSLWRAWPASSSSGPPPLPLVGPCPCCAVGSSPHPLLLKLVPMVPQPPTPSSVLPSAMTPGRCCSISDRTRPALLAAPLSLIPAPSLASICLQVAVSSSLCAHELLCLARCCSLDPYRARLFVVVTRSCNELIAPAFVLCPCHVPHDLCPCRRVEPVKPRPPLLDLVFALLVVAVVSGIWACLPARRRTWVPCSAFIASASSFVCGRASAPSQHPALVLDKKPKRIVMPSSSSNGNRRADTPMSSIAILVYANSV
jgi:hypothetical protein